MALPAGRRDRLAPPRHELRGGAADHRPLLLETPDGPVTSQLTAGVSYYRSIGVEHNVINPGEAEFVFVEVEIKQASH